MKSRYAESFLFPNSQLDFNRPETFYSSQGLHGFDAVPAGYYAAHPDEKTQIEQTIASYESELANARRDEAAIYADPKRIGEVDLIRQIINSWTQWIQDLREQLREDQSINDAAAKAVADINAKAEAAAAAAAQAAAQQQAADVFAQAGAEQARQLAQQQADEFARQAAAQQAAAAAATAAAGAAVNAATNASDEEFRRQTRELAALEAARQAAEAAAAAAAQQAAAAAAAGKKITLLALDSDTNGVYLFGKYADGSDAVLARGAAAIDAWFKANGLDQGSASKTAAYVKAVSATQTAAVDTSSGIVQHTDTASGTTTTTNTKTGTIVVTDAAGGVASGTGRFIAGGVITTVDQNTGTVTTQNTQTGVVTQTSSTNGQTVTAVQVSGGSNTGGTFMVPDSGKTVTTTTPITGGTDAGKLALVGLLGLLLLRGAVR